MTTQRDTFFQTIGDAYKQGRKDLVVLTADMGAAALNEYKGSDFLINPGPCEQLVITMAAGLALQGAKPFCYGIAPFISLRAIEQIRVSVCSMDLPVTIVGVGSGLSYDTAGLTHHGTEDLSTMRTIPNMNIVNISTIEMAKWYAKFSMEYKHPLYVRLDKKAYNQTFIPLYGWFTHNYGVVNRVNKNVAIITTGVFTQYLLEQKSVLPKNSFILEVYRFPCEQKKLSTFLESCAKIITVEEGYTTGGLGDYIASLGFKVTKIGLSTFCETQLRQHYWDKLLTEIKNELQGEKREGR